MEVVKNIGVILGYVLTAFTLFALIKTKFLGALGGYVKKETNTDGNDEQHKELNDRLDSLDKKLNEFIVSDQKWKDEIRSKMQNQNDASRQLMAGVIEKLYYKKRDVKKLDSVEFKRLINSYNIYHDELKGNSYITALYEEMMAWERED